jgi:hypothetical protein
LLTTAFAHVAALIAGYIAGLVVNLVFGIANVAVAGVLVAAASGLLLKQGVALESVERLNAKTIASFFFITGVIEGIAKILLAVVIFGWFDRQVGWPMVVLFAAFQLIPFISALDEQHRANMRSGSAGALLGLVGTWLAISQ